MRKLFILSLLLSSLLSSCIDAPYGAEFLEHKYAEFSGRELHLFELMKFDPTVNAWVLVSSSPYYDYSIRPRLIKVSRNGMRYEVCEGTSPYHITGCDDKKHHIQGLTPLDEHTGRDGILAREFDENEYIVLRYTDGETIYGYRATLKLK